MKVRKILFRSETILLLLVLVLLQPACVWRLWTKKPPLEERTFSVYGTVESVDPSTLLIETRRGENMEFVFVDSSVKGSDFGPGAYVHVYYRIRDESKEITMVVERIN